MKVGFTGTQKGMTEYQKNEVKFLLTEWFDPVRSQFHHGDCVGADEEAACIARDIGYTIHCHPPINDFLRAYSEYDVVYDAKPYLDRNHDIVDTVEYMLGTPKEKEEQLRSGTWATIRYSKKVGTYIKIIPPWIYE